MAEDKPFTDRVNIKYEDEIKRAFQGSKVVKPQPKIGDAYRKMVGDWVLSGHLSSESRFAYWPTCLVCSSLRVTVKNRFCRPCQNKLTPRMTDLWLKKHPDHFEAIKNLRRLGANQSEIREFVRRKR